MTCVRTAFRALAVRDDVKSTACDMATLLTLPLTNGVTSALSFALMLPYKRLAFSVAGSLWGDVRNQVNDIALALVRIRFEGEQVCQLFGLVEVCSFQTITTPLETDLAVREVGSV